ncbi:60S ribosomal subunit assembly export protein loc-1 [Niveomyces insectorum RCEF 264]|uniref:60S ribosomal subunit assembly export protein loc-1 n=1 Tax=Niveomyces insectorum RCEF 264 TaxID=1081102 RepID=A0A167TC87_9HYPO|nr:60S ribosomal subunit assembly export protein loc-1 [Niveomyces insectorum RCEF 264]
MAPTRTIKNKHAANKSGIKNSRSATARPNDSVVKARRNKSSTKGGKPPATPPVTNRTKLLEMLKKRRKGRTYTDKELDIPKLNTITPVGVQKPKGKKKGKVFVDDKESMTTILAMVQAEKDGQIESKIMKARQMEEIRQARLAEAEKKEGERQAKLDETKASLRKKRKRTTTATGGSRAGEDSHDGIDASIRALAAAGSKAVKTKKKRVSFARDPKAD